MQKEIRDYAEYIGLNLDTFPELSWIAEEGLHSPIPKDWVVVKNGQGGHYFQHTASGATQSDHPMDEHYRRVGEREMSRVNAERKRESDLAEEKATAAAEAQQQLIREQQRRLQEQQRKQEELRRQQQQRLEEQLSGATYNQQQQQHLYNSDGTPSRDAMRARVTAAQRARNETDDIMESSTPPPPLTRGGDRAVTTPSHSIYEELSPAQPPRSEIRRTDIKSLGNTFDQEGKQIVTPTSRKTAVAARRSTGQIDEPSAPTITKADNNTDTHRNLRFWGYLVLGCLLLHSVVSNTVLNSQLMSSAPPGGGGGVSEPTADALAQILRQSAKNRIFIVKPLPREEVPPSEAVEPLAAEATTTSAPSKQQSTT
ncbi:Hypothetical protein, putative, partial [Bodo saltans]